MIDLLSQRLNILFKYETLETRGVRLKLTQFFGDFNASTRIQCSDFQF